ncbi:MAG: hypothetical protein U0103_03000 [Candidatus Obscuribacterales bacterium]
MVIVIPFSEGVVIVADKLTNLDEGRAGQIRNYNKVYPIGKHCVIASVGNVFQMVRRGDASFRYDVNGSLAGKIVAALSASPEVAPKFQASS